MEIPLLFFFLPAGQAETALHGGTAFRWDDQSRIAGVCREIRCLGELELTLCSSGEQEEFFLPATFVTVEV
jgi:hypothetical protein